MEATADRRAPLTLVLLCAGGFLVSLQQTLAIPLMADLPDELHTAPGNTTWLIGAGLLSGTVSTPVLTRLGDVYGKRRLILITIGALVVGSLVGGLTHSFAVVIAARAVQGAAIALLPLGLAVMRDELPPARLPLGTAALSSTLAIGAGAGLPLSGALVDGPGWRWIFWIPAIAGTVLLCAVVLALPESPVRGGGGVDPWGALLLSSGLCAVILALSHGSAWGWISMDTVLLGVGGLAVLAFFGVVELRSPAPLVDLRLAARPRLVAAHAVSLLLGFAAYANMMVTPQLLQQPADTGYGLGLDAATAGLWLVPMALSFGIFAPAAPVVVRRWGAETTVGLGAMVMAVSYVGRVYLSDGLAQVVAGSVAVSLGTVLTYAALPIVVMSDVPASQSAAANGLNHLLRTVGSVVSSAATASAISGMVMETAPGVTLPSYDAQVLMFWLAAGASLVSVAVLAWSRRHAPSEPTA
ncbi:MFS transporter [Actinomadura rugatobispora]|uniref:MFS transporter n=1 Tax=Actinomadura rugatobispora TaxID=1994 RepID=A0ABW1A263_9ACTN|nr:MFS transporter [Actinomadura rugatobispora]